jgi:drug/metabolite transporter (DMT)-like permease
MRSSDYARLFVLAAIWGGSFIFMRVLAPALGAVLTAALRVAISGLVLVAYLRLAGIDMAWRTRWHHYFAIGMLNSGIPFTLFGFAALHLPAGYSAIINSLTPIFGALFAALWLGEALTPARITGLALGLTGVTLVAWRGGHPPDAYFIPAVLACVGATICYAFTGMYLKKFAATFSPLATSGCSLLASAVLLGPVAATSAPHLAAFTPTITLCLLALALLCSAVAYTIYYRLMRDVGPTRAFTVTFLTPGFGMLWGVLFLGEPVTAWMLVGFALVVLGTLTVGGTLKSLSSLLPRRA